MRLSLAGTEASSAVLGFECGLPRAKRRPWTAKHELAKHGSSALPSARCDFILHLFPADCRICGSPLVRVSRLPVCESCLTALRPLQGRTAPFAEKTCIFRLPSTRPDQNRARRISANRVPALSARRSSFERAVAYGSYDRGLRDMIHLLSSAGASRAAILGACWRRPLSASSPRCPSHDRVVPCRCIGASSPARFNQAEMIARAALKRSRVRKDLSCARQFCGVAGKPEARSA